MANSSIYAAFERMWQHVVAKLGEKVSTTRKVNNKALSSDITLSASDVGAVPTSRTVNGKALSSNITLAASDVSAVPTTRTVNGKALSSDITLSASDLDIYVQSTEPTSAAIGAIWVDTTV